MANAEQKINFAEKSGDFVMRLGLVGALIGIVTKIAGMQIGGPLFVAGAELGVAGWVGKKLAGSGKK